MNAVARAIASHNTSNTLTVLVDFGQIKLKIAVLIILLLISALGIIYIRDLNRRLFISYSRLQKQAEKLQVNNTKLILEHSSWAAQSRVQLIAKHQLQMKIPSPTDVVIIKRCAI